MNASQALVASSILATRLTEIYVFGWGDLPRHFRTNSLRIALTVDLPECSLCRGQGGTVVEVLAKGATFEVEFSVYPKGELLRNATDEPASL